MKQFFTLLSVFCFVITNYSQSILVPGDNTIEKKWIKSNKTEMGYFAVTGGNTVEICSFVIDIHSDNNRLALYTTLKFLGTNEQWSDTSISDGDAFKPIYRSSFRKDQEYILKFGKEVSGYYYDKKAKKRTIVKESISEPFFDSYTYPYLLGMLPLTAGYKKELVVYDYKPGSADNIKKAKIEEVKSNIYFSNLTGEHKVWQVSVFEEATNDKYEYYIDKVTRRIWKINVFSNGLELLLVDKEIDFNPFTNPFNKEETLKLIKSGSAVINGQVFARDNENGGLLKGMAVLNVNKKQYASVGTSIILIPYTPFFKEWIKLNDAAKKKGTSIPLPQGAGECIKVTTVYDKEGSFEFVNLMPGDYLLYTEFGYIHTSSRTEVIGYTDTYINGMFQGSSANTTTSNYSSNASAFVKKIVTIDKEGEQVTIKLKKTL
jgi:hypothetical protein